MIELSLKEMIRVHEQPRIVASDQSRIPLLVFEIECYNRFVDFTWMPMYYAFHSEGSIKGLFGIHVSRGRFMIGWQGGMR